MMGRQEMDREVRYTPDEFSLRRKQMYRAVTGIDVTSREGVVVFPNKSLSGIVY